jgi:hypothetical protein
MTAALRHELDVSRANYFARGVFGQVPERLLSRG